MESSSDKYQQFILNKNSYETEWKSVHQQIFKVASDPSDSICPPEQVFQPQYHFLFKVGGGSFAEDQVEYEAWMDCFRFAGDEHFAVVENIGCTTTSRQNPYRTVFSVGTSFDLYAAAEEVLNEPQPFRLGINHYHIFGKSANWGLYLAEWPTVLIIGCKTEFVDIFRERLDIKGNGYSAIKTFIQEEFNLAKKRGTTQDI